MWAHFEEAYYSEGEVLHRRSAAPERAVVVDDDESSVGVRKVAVRFCDGSEQLLPIEWVVAAAAAGTETAPPRAPEARSRLADNWLQQCPVPTWVELGASATPNPNPNPNSNPNPIPSPSPSPDQVPTVHLLRGDELAEEALRAGADAIDALQCRNAQIARSRRTA